MARRVSLLLALILTPVTPGAERHAATVQNLPGMPAAISDVAQDAHGFLWVSSAEGLFRFDGTEFLRRSERIALDWVVAGPGGHVVAGQQDMPWIEWDGERLAPLSDADGIPIPEVQDVTFEPQGALWVLTRTGVHRRDTAGRWIEIPLAEGQTGRSIAVHPDGGVVCGTRRGSILRLHEGRPTEELVTGLEAVVTHVVVDRHGAIVANLRWGPRSGVVRLDGRRIRQLLVEHARPTGLALRGETVWSSWDTGVFALRPDQPPERLHPRDGFHGGGNVRVDREATLWITGFNGLLVRFAEPETRVYTERSGLDRGPVRQVVRAGASRWATSWTGLMRYVPAEDRWVPFDGSALRLASLACGHQNGDLFTTGAEVAPSGAGERGALVRIRGDDVRRLGDFHIPVPETLCARAPDGALWIVFDRDVYRAPAGDEPQRVGRLPDTVAPARAATAAPDGGLWVVGLSNTLCGSSDPSSGEWDCSSPDGLRDVFDLVFLDDGTMWVATFGQGLLACTRASCEPALDPSVLGVNEVITVEPSSRGGFWVQSRTTVVRLVPGPAGATVAERLTPWQGLPPWWMASLIEDPDGTVWVVGLAGIARVPASARQGRVPAPPVQATRLAVGGRTQPLDRPVRAISGRDTIELHWAALSFRDPVRLRYRFRLDTALPWADTQVPRLALVAPQAGRYRLEVAAAIEPTSWSVAPAVVDLRVVPPWFRRPSFLAGITVALAALVGAGYRLRVAHLLRLERQRTQIAMDLHDDIGSTLGGIGLLASLAGDERVAPDARKRALDRIEDQTSTVASALADIVWSLRPGAETLDQLVLALRERASDLVPNGRIDIRFDVPDPPPRVRLTLPVRRNVQWIAVEALRNAVRHGEPSRISVRLEAAGAAWRLAVEDDGHGIGDGPKPSIRGGMGLDNMRRRAAAVRARLEVGPGDAGGARIALTFRPDGRAP